MLHPVVIDVCIFQIGGAIWKVRTLSVDQCCLVQKSPTFSLLTGFDSPEPTQTGARVGLSAQSSRKPHLPLSKATSKQAESTLAERSPRLSPVGSVERQFQVCQFVI